MTTIIDKKWLNEHRQEGNSLPKQVDTYLGTATGSQRLFQVGQKTLKVGLEVANQLGSQVVLNAPELVECKQKLGIAAGAFSIPRVFSATHDACLSMHEWSNATDAEFAQKARKVGKDAMELIGSWGTCLLYLKAIPIRAVPAVSIVLQVMDITNDVLDIANSAISYTKASQLEETATGEAKEAVNHSKKYYLIQVAKAVVSLVASILGIALGIMMVSSGVPLVALLALSLAVTAISIYRDFHKSMGRYTVIPFDGEVKLFA